MKFVLLTFYFLVYMSILPLSQVFVIVNVTVNMRLLRNNILIVHRSWLLGVMDRNIVTCAEWVTCLIFKPRRMKLLTYWSIFQTTKLSLSWPVTNFHNHKVGCPGNEGQSKVIFSQSHGHKRLTKVKIKQQWRTFIELFPRTRYYPKC